MYVCCIFVVWYEAMMLFRVGTSDESHRNMSIGAELLVISRFSELIYIFVIMDFLNQSLIVFVNI